VEMGRARSSHVCISQDSESVLVENMYMFSGGRGMPTQEFDVDDDDDDDFILQCLKESSNDILLERLDRHMK
jgi:hypothetical protein